MDFNRRLEPLKNYRPGGFHPVSILDDFHGRYRVVHKLGHGSFSTVWLAWDHQRGMLVSLKILTADASRSSSDARILRHLHPEPGWVGYFLNRTHPGQAFVLAMLDDFEIRGPNGIHRCIVAEVLGPSVDDVGSFGPARLPLPVARKLAVQFAKGLAYIHSRGVIHGDLSPKNILLCIPGISSWTVDDVYRRFGEPVKAPTSGEHASAPSYLVEPIDCADLMELCLTEDCAIKITDFGQSIIYADGQRMDESFKTTFSIAAPEVIFTAPQSQGPAIDVWAFACTLANILGDGPMFSSSSGNTDKLFFKWVRALGKLPDEWWGRWEGRSEEFEEDGSFKPDPDEVYFENSLRQRLVDIRIGRGRESAFGSRELDALEVLFGRMLKYHASERITAEEIVGLMPVAWEKGIFV